MVILGTPVGSPEFVQRFLGNRLDVQTRFWDRLKQVPDLQAAWLLLLYCAVPRANHLIRAIPPDLVANYAQAHDGGIWATFLDLIGQAPRPARDPAHEGAEQLPLSWPWVHSPRRSTASSAGIRRCGCRTNRRRSPRSSRKRTSRRNRRAWAEPGSGASRRAKGIT